jgi:PTS system nitrogen regulatory IIA component
MNQLAPLLNSDTILLDQHFTSKKQLFEHASERFSSQNRLKAADVFNSLFERERLGSTALGYGIAIPHGRLKGLPRASGALYRLATPIEFDAPDQQPVNLCFFLLVPKDATDQHLQILGELAQLFGDEQMRTRMLAAPGTADLHRLIVEWPA